MVELGPPRRGPENRPRHPQDHHLAGLSPKTPCTPACEVEGHARSSNQTRRSRRGHHPRTLKSTHLSTQPLTTSLTQDTPGGHENQSIRGKIVLTPEGPPRAGMLQLNWVASIEVDGIHNHQASMVFLGYVDSCVFHDSIASSLRHTVAQVHDLST